MEMEFIKELTESPREPATGAWRPHVQEQCPNQPRALRPRVLGYRSRRCCAQDTAAVSLGSAGSEIRTLALPPSPSSSPGEDSTWGLLPTLLSSKSKPCMDASGGLSLGNLLSVNHSWDTDFRLPLGE